MSTPKIETGSRQADGSEWGDWDANPDPYRVYYWILDQSDAWGASSLFENLDIWYHKISYLRVIRGKLTEGMELLNTRTGNKEKVSQLFAVAGKNRIKVTALRANSAWRRCACTSRPATRWSSPRTTTDTSTPRPTETSTHSRCPAVTPSV